MVWTPNIQYPFLCPFCVILKMLNQKLQRRDKKNIYDPDVIRTRNLLIWSQTRYRCATGPPFLHSENQQNAYNTRDSQAVTHPSTNPARPGLTSVIRREPVLSRWYGRRRKNWFKLKHVYAITDKSSA